MSPSYDQLTAWCDLHGIAIKRDTNGVRATAYDRSFSPITTVLEIMDKVDARRDAEATAALKVCDLIAEELLLLKPSVVFRLNQS